MTAFSKISDLRFNEAQLSIGDELRAARASIGRSLADVERDLRIKAKYIEGIERCDYRALPSKVYVDGYVRTYAGYLGRDPEETLRRFVETCESRLSKANKGASGEACAAVAGDVNPLAKLSRDESGRAVAVRGLQGAAAVWPLLALGVVACGMWFGIGAARDAGIIPQDLDLFGRVSDERPLYEANAAGPLDPVDGAIGGASERPAELTYARKDALPYWTSAGKGGTGPDGPIEAIDETAVGLFPGAKVAAATTPVPRAPQFDPRDIAAEARAALTSGPAAGSTGDAAVAMAAVPVVDPSRYALVARQDTWIEVRRPGGRIAFSGILKPGDEFAIPDGEGLTMKVGNAGGLFVALGAEELGPFGGDGRVMSRIPLERQALLLRFSGE